MIFEKFTSQHGAVGRAIAGQNCNALQAAHTKAPGGDGPTVTRSPPEIAHAFTNSWREQPFPSSIGW